MSWSVADCVAANARSAPDRVAIEVLDPRESGVEPVSTWTYGDVWARVEAIAATLGGVRPGPNGPMVGIMLPNSVDHLAAYLACQVAGAAAVPVNNRLAGPEVEFVLKDSGASVLLAGDPMGEVATAAAAATGTTLVDVAGIPASAPTTWTGPVGPEGATRLALVAYTSGTTGFPKGSTVTNDGLMTRFSQWSWTFGLSPNQVLSTPGPVFHMSYGGLSLAHLVSGGRNRLMVDFDPQVALDEYRSHSSWVFLVPSMTAMIAEAWETTGGPALDRLEWMLSSGAPGPMSLLDRAFDVFPRAHITEAYGWSEGGWVTYEVKRRDDLVPHSVGWPVLGTEVDVRDDEGRPCPPGDPGEVVARSVTPFLGYLGNGIATEAAMTDDGFCRSGDVGIMLPDGRLTIVDRVKDMIISGGENVYCAEVERILVEHPGIVEAAVVGLPDETWGERVTGVVVTRRGVQVDPDEVIVFCRERLAAYKCPKQVVERAELPRNPMGKVQKFRLVDELWQGC
ncbi:MAG: acyl--CoA ligase [Actinomycetia bacterium]|nr:acyl--CoA ligase [Actinomycetes bacterium]